MRSEGVPEGGLRPVRSTVSPSASDTRGPAAPSGTKARQRAGMAASSESTCSTARGTTGSRWFSGSRVPSQGETDTMRSRTAALNMDARTPCTTATVDGASRWSTSSPFTQCLDVGRPHGGDAPLAEQRVDVQPEDGLDPVGARRAVHLRGAPLLAVLADRHPAGGGGDVLPGDDRRRLLVEPSLRVGLAAERPCLLPSPRVAVHTASQGLGRPGRLRMDAIGTPPGNTSAAR